MISRRFIVNKRTLPTTLIVALPQLGFLRALFVRTCSPSSFSHGPFCYHILPWTTIASHVFGVFLISIPVGILLDRGLVQRVPSWVRSKSPTWLTSPSNPTLAVFVALFLGLGLLTVSDPKLSVWWSFYGKTTAETVQSVIVWGLYVPSLGVGFGGSYFLGVLRGLVGVTALPVRLLIFGLMLVCSVVQVVWLYAVAAASVAGFRRVQLAVESKKRVS